MRPKPRDSLLRSWPKKPASNWVLAELALLLEATGGDASRIAIEIEKLRLFAGTARKVTAGDIAALVPDAQSSTIFVSRRGSWKR